MPSTKHAGTTLLEWITTHEPDEELIYNSGFWAQVNFVNDILPYVFASIFKREEIQAATQVISTHTSKSVLLPVYSIKLPDGTVFTMRCNFYDWKVSVNSPREVVADFVELFDPEERRSILGVYCEGFPPDRVYGPYVDNKQRFTVKLPSGNYCLFTFLWILVHKHVRKPQ